MATAHVIEPRGGRNEAAAMAKIFTVIFFVGLLSAGFPVASAGLNCTLEGDSCESLIVFHPQPNLNASTLEGLFGTDYQASDSDDPNSKWLIPVNCSCVDGTYLSVVNYTVKPGEFLSLIARHYQNLTTWQRIQEVSQVEDADRIQPGDLLRVPIPCGCMANATNITYVTYGRQEGDTADSIAEEMRANVSHVMEAMEADPNNTVLVFPLGISATVPSEPAPESAPVPASVPAPPRLPPSAPPRWPSAPPRLPSECSSPNDSCPSLIVFHPEGPEPTQNITWISRLYGNEKRIEEQNRGSDTAAKWFIPVQCSCSNGMYRSLTTYTVMQGDSLSIIATYYQNLTTWRGLHDVNPRENPHNIDVNEILNVSIPCKCGKGKTYVTYGWQEGDTAETVAAATNASVPDVQEAETRANETGMVLVFPTSRQVVSPSGDSVMWSPSVLTILIQVVSVITWLML